MQYDPIQGQGHEPFKVGNASIFKCYILRYLQLELATDHWHEAHMFCKNVALGTSWSDYRKEGVTVCLCVVGGYDDVIGHV